MPAKSTLFLAQKGMQTGIGAIAKGQALDRAADILRAAGFNDLLIFGGGEVPMQGHRGKPALAHWDLESTRRVTTG